MWFKRKIKKGIWLIDVIVLSLKDCCTFQLMNIKILIYAEKHKGYYIAGAVSQQYCALIPLYFLRMIDQRSLTMDPVKTFERTTRFFIYFYFILYIKITYEHKRGSYDQRLASCVDRLIMFICWVPCIRYWGILHLKRFYIVSINIL